MWAFQLQANPEMTPFLLMWTMYEVESGCVFTLMKSVRVLYMWAPLGRKKQLPGLTSLKKNSSWSCRETCKHDIYHSDLFLFIRNKMKQLALCSSPTVPMRLWSLLRASSCSLSHSCLSLSVGKATPCRRVARQGSVSLAWVTDDSWDGPDMEWWRGESDRENNESTTERDGEGQPEKGDVTARLMGATVFVRQENRKLASDKHNILLWIFPAWLPWNPTLPSDSPIWKVLPPPWINKDDANSIFPLCVPEDGQTCQICPNQTNYTNHEQKSDCAEEF